MNLLRVDFDFGDLVSTESAELLGSTLRAEFSFPMIGPAGASGDSSAFVINFDGSLSPSNAVHIQESSFELNEANELTPKG